MIENLCKFEKHQLENSSLLFGQIVTHKAAVIKEVILKNQVININNVCVLNVYLVSRWTTNISQYEKAMKS